VQPVCGINGKTYGNGCMALIDKVPVSYRGKCRSAQDADSKNDTQSATGSNATNATAPDEKKVENCTQEIKPVCGSDGTVYRNACLAKKVGAEIAPDNKCQNGLTPSGANGISSRQAGYTLCNAITCTTIGVGSTQADARNNGNCTIEFKPVCATNGLNYRNECIARNSGATIKSQGQCPPKQAVQKSLSSNSAADCVNSYSPVCGTDGKTYSNDCIAKSFGVPVASKGVCSLSNLDAPKDCTKNYAPVCGDDGKTYGNSCMAKSLGVKVASSGACKSQALKTPTAPQQRPPNQANTPQCPSNYSPVCGSDRQTYSNACVAQNLGVTVVSVGVCSKAKANLASS
jgi:hypothetical protein